MDTRYQHRFEFKYDEKKRLTEETDFLSNGDIVSRSVYKHGGNQKEELVYENGSLARRHLHILDDKGNVIERSDFAPNGSVLSKLSYTYEFDSNGNWTKRSNSWNVASDRLRRLSPSSVHCTIAYY